MSRDRLKIILLELCWGFGKPKSQFQNRVRLFSRSAIGIAIAYLVFLINPQVVFSHSLTHQNYTIHSDHPLPAETFDVLKRADRLLQESEIFSRNDHHHIFLCNGPGWFRTFNPRGSDRLYATSHATGNIFIANGDPATDMAWKTSGTNIIRSLSGLIAHEVTHNLVRDHLGVLPQWRLPAWKNEGYAEYISIHGQKEYELAIAKDLPRTVKPNSIHPVYQGHLTRVLMGIGESTNRFEALMRAD